MGVTASDLNAASLARTRDSDRHVLSDYASDPSMLADMAVMQAAFGEMLSGVGTAGSGVGPAISSWLPPSNHAMFHRKKQQIARKMEDSRAVLALMPHHMQARDRLLKCCQRLSHFLVSGVSPMRGTLHARASLLQRALLAHSRWLKRESDASDMKHGGAPQVDAHGNLISQSQDARPMEQVTDKFAFLEHLFARSLDEQAQSTDESGNTAMYTTFMSSEEFVAQLCSLIPDNLPSEKSEDEELEEWEAKQKEAGTEERKSDDAQADASTSVGAPTVPTPLSPPPVHVWGLTGLLGLPYASPSSAAAAASASSSSSPSSSSVDEEEPKPESGESDSAYATRLQLYIENKKKSRDTRVQRMREIRQAKKADQEKRQQQLDALEKLRTAYAARSLTPAELSTVLPPLDPDVLLPSEAIFSSMQMVELLIEESQKLTQTMIETAEKEYDAFKRSKQTEDKTKEETSEGEKSEGSPVSPSIYPLSPLPATHLLFLLVRDLLRRATYCTDKRQRTVEQLYAVMRKLIDASTVLLDASKKLTQYSISEKDDWNAFEKKLRYETPAVGSLHTLFKDCSTTSHVPAAPSQGSSSSSSGGGSGSGSSQSASPSATIPLSTAASTQAPLLSIILSTSLLQQVMLPVLSYAWAAMLHPIIFDNIAQEQTNEDEGGEGKKESSTSTHNSSLLTSLISFLHTLDAFNASLPSSASEERLFSLVSDGVMRSLAGNERSVIVESPHTYFPDTSEQQVVHIPNASHLVIEFDSKCSTETGRDHLTLTVPHPDTDGSSSMAGFMLPQPPIKVAGPFHGPREKWPRNPIVVRNTDTVVFNFHSEQANNAATYWGYRAIVTGYTNLNDLPRLTSDANMTSVVRPTGAVTSTGVVPSSSRPRSALPSLSHSRPWFFLFDLQQTLAHVIGRALRKETIAHDDDRATMQKSAAMRPDQIDAIHKYLHSPIFYAAEEEEENSASGTTPAPSPTPSPESPSDGAAPAATDADSPSWERSFLRDMIEGTAGTPGTQLDTLMRKQLQSKRVDMLGGAVTKKTVRAFIACLLHHVGLVPLAAQWLRYKDPSVANSLPDLPALPDAASSNDAAWASLGEQLVDLWKKGQTLHQTIVSGKQGAQQALDNLIAEEEATKKAVNTAAASHSDTDASSASSSSSASATSSSSDSSSTATDTTSASGGAAAIAQRLTDLVRQRAESLATYDGYTAGLREKCEFLLKRPSFSHHPLSSLSDASAAAAAATHAPTMDRTREQFETAELVCQSSDNLDEEQTLHSIMRIYHTAQHQKQSSEDEERLRCAHTHFTSLTDLIFSFVRDDIPLSSIRAARAQQVHRARRRARTLGTLLDLLQRIRSHSSQLSLLYTFGPPFRRYVAYPLGVEDESAINDLGGHYLNGIEASGRANRLRVQRAFQSLYAYLISLIQTDGGQHNGGASLAMRSLVLDALCIDWHATVRENSWLHEQQLLPILEALLRQAQPGADASMAMQPTEPTPFYQLANNLLVFLSLNCMQTQTRTSISTKKRQRKQAAVAMETTEHKDETDEKKDDSERQTVVPAISTNNVTSPLSFLSTSFPVISAPLDSLQRHVLDRLVSSVQHGCSLLSGLRRQVDLSEVDMAELVDLDVTPEQRHLLYRRKARPSAHSAVSLASAEERQAQMAGLLPTHDDESGMAFGEEDEEIDYTDAHPSFPLVRRYMQVEKDSYDALSVLCSLSSLSHHRALLDFLLHAPCVRTFLLVSVSGSPRMQTLALRMLAQLLPWIDATHVRDYALAESLNRLEKDEKFGAMTKRDGGAFSTPAPVSASSTPFSMALAKSYEPQQAPSAFSLGDAMPVPGTLSLSRSSSLQARAATDAILRSDDAASESKLDQAEVDKFVTHLFKRLGELLVSTIDAADTTDGPATRSRTPPLRRSPVPSPSSSPTPTSPSPLIPMEGTSNTATGGDSTRQKHVNPLQYRDGEMQLVLAAEIVTLIRALHSHTTLTHADGSAPVHQPDWSQSIDRYLGSHLLSLPRLVSSEEPRVRSASLKSDVAQSLACLRVIGGASEPIRVGGIVQPSGKAAAAGEVGLVVAVDRAANRVRLLFKHQPTKLVEMEHSKLLAVDAIPADAALLTLSRPLLSAFNIFTKALAEEERERQRIEDELETKRKEKAEREELERLQREFNREQEALMDPFGGFHAELESKWSCPACTFENPVTKPQCEICFFENPNFFIQKKTVVEEESDDEEEMQRALTRTTLTIEALLYYQLRSAALSALTAMMQQQSSLLLLLDGGATGSSSSLSILPSLVSMAIRPTQLDTFKSLSSLEACESRLAELLYESGAGMVPDSVRFNKQQTAGSQLHHSPFRHLQLHLPTCFDAASARGVTFVGDRDSMREIRYMGGSSGIMHVGIARSNFLVPNSLPAYYFEVKVINMGQATFPHANAPTASVATPRSGYSSPALTPQLVRQSSPVLRALAGPPRIGSSTSPQLSGSSGASTSASGSTSSSAFDIAIGFFRCGMPLEGLPGKHSTYAYSGRNGELHLTRNRTVMREKLFKAFKNGDVVGCGMQVRYGQRTIFFTLNGKLLVADSDEQFAQDAGMDALDLGPAAVSATSPTLRKTTSTSAITSISGVEANLSGRFYPAVWMENAGSHVRINFGQENFLYDFATHTLPQDYQQKLAAMEVAAASGAATQKLSEAEIKRRTMAEDLKEIMGNFPIELCVLALERNNDDMALAGDWLFSHGQKELDRMAADALRAQQEEKRRGSRQEGNGADEEEDSSGDEDDLADYLSGGDASNVGARESRNRDSASTLLDDEVDADIPIGLDLAPRQHQHLHGGAGVTGSSAAGLSSLLSRGGGPESDRQRERARAILQLRGRGAIGDEEVERLLTSVMGMDRAGGGDDDSATAANADIIIYENVKLDEIQPGQPLTVSPACVRISGCQHHWMSSFAGRTGVVTRVNINSQLVSLIFHDTSSAIKRCASFPVQALHRPQRAWQDPLRDMFERREAARSKSKNKSKKDDNAEQGEDEDSMSFQDLAHEYVTNERALSVHKVRRAVLRVIARWPSTLDFNVALLNGPNSLLSVLKLTAAQFLSSSSKRHASTPVISQQTDAELDALTDEQGQTINLLDAFRNKLVSLMKRESEQILNAARKEGKQLTAALAPPIRITEGVYMTQDASKSVENGKESAASSSLPSIPSQPSSAHESELSEDDNASQASHRALSASSAGVALRRRVDRQEHQQAEDDAQREMDEEHDADDDEEDAEEDEEVGEDEEDEGEEGEYDDDEEVDDGEYDEEGEYEADPDHGRLLNLADALHMLPHQVGGGRGMSLFNSIMIPRGGGAGGGLFAARSSAPQPIHSHRSHRRKRKQRTSEEKSAAAAQSQSLDERMQQLLQQSRPSASSFVSPLLVDECIVHLITSVHHGPPVRTVRSAHPYASHTEVRGKIAIGGARKLLIRFDPRCQIGTDVMTRLSFYRDRHYQDLILSLQGSGPAPDGVFPPLIIDTDRVWYKFVSGTNTRLWGYKFRVEPIDLRIDDKSALSCRNFELATWLLDLLLTNSPPLFQCAYIADLFHALTFYVLGAKPARKSRGVDMLVRVLFKLREYAATTKTKEDDSNNTKSGGNAAARTDTQANVGSAIGKLAELRAAGQKSATEEGSSTSATSPTMIAASSPSSPSFRLVRRPDFSRLQPLAHQLDSVLDSLGLGSSAVGGRGAGVSRQLQLHRSLQNPTMMGLVELISTLDLIRCEFEHAYGQESEQQQMSKRVTTSTSSRLSAAESLLAPPHSDTIDLHSDFAPRLRIERALLLFHCPPADKSGGHAPKDVTAALQQLLATQGHVQLFIPTDPNVQKEMAVFDGEVSASSISAVNAAAASSSSSSASSASSSKPKYGYSKLDVSYSILSPVWDSATGQAVRRVMKSQRKTIPLLAHQKPTLIRPEPSRFDNVVNMSRLTLQMRTDKGQGQGQGQQGQGQTQTQTASTMAPASPDQLPADFMLEAYRNHFIQRHFYQLVGERLFETSNAKGGNGSLIRPSPIMSGSTSTRSYTLSFWLYLNNNTVPPAKDAHFRYILHTGNLAEQSSSNLAYGVVWPLSGFSLGLGSKDGMLHAVFFEPSGNSRIVQHTRSTLTPKRWTHVTMVVTDGMEVSLYLDGQLELSHKCVTPLPSLPSDPFIIGSLPFSMLKLYRNQTRSANDSLPEDPYRAGVGFSGAVRDMRLYLYDIDQNAFFAAIQRQMKKHERERGNKTGFTLPVERQIVVSKKELREAVEPVVTVPRPLLASSAPSSSSSSTSILTSTSSVLSSVVWTSEMDMQVIELFSNIVTAIRNRRPADRPEDEDEEDQPQRRDTSVQLIDLPLSSKAVTHAITADPKLLASAPLLSHLPLHTLKQRFSAIQLLNMKLVDVLPFCDFTQALNEWSLAHRLSNISWLILLEVKNKAWKAILQSTAVGHTVNVNINRPRALRAKERGNDPDALKSIFGQLFQQLHFIRPSMLRIQQGNRPFRVKLAGEGAIDAGGPFRDVISDVCSSLMSRDTPLFVPCPNAGGYGDFQHTFVPNPSSVSSLHQSMYQFVGKFMGLAIRGGHVLNIDFPPPIWSLLVGRPLSRSALLEFNALAYRIIQQYAEPNMQRDEFDKLPMQRFVTMTSDGREIELKPGGANVNVTFDNRFEYVELEENYRLHEFDLAVSHMRKGLGTIVPVHLLSLFTGVELETLVCGSREISIDFLRRHTDYSRGIRASDPHVKWLWETLEEFSQKERQAFVRFVSGQSRLWSSESDFIMRFKLLPAAVDNDTALPISHTCFFSLELPRPSSKEILRNKLLYAINNCMAIDADTAAENLDWNEE